jgi:hypothetical protein
VCDPSKQYVAKHKRSLVKNARDIKTPRSKLVFQWRQKTLFKGLSITVVPCPMTQIRNIQCIVEGPVRNKSPIMPIKNFHQHLFHFRQPWSHDRKNWKSDISRLVYMLETRFLFYSTFSRSWIAMKSLLRISISVFPIASTHDAKVEKLEKRYRPISTCKYVWNAFFSTPTFRGQRL